MPPNQQMMGYNPGYNSQQSQVAMDMLSGHDLGMSIQPQMNTQLGVSPAPGMQYTLSSDGTVSDAGGLLYTMGNTLQAGPSTHIGNTFSLDPSVSGLNVNATQMLASSSPSVTDFQTDFQNTEWPRSTGPVLKKRKTRACVKCNGSKTKCDSEWPCCESASIPSIVKSSDADPIGKPHRTARCTSRKIECVYLSRDQEGPNQEPTVPSTLPIGSLPANQMPIGNVLPSETVGWIESAVGKDAQQPPVLIPHRIDSSNSAHWSTPTLATEQSPASDVSGHMVVATNSAPMARSTSDNERVVTPGNTAQPLDVSLRRRLPRG
jgi:hypothetical protein